MQLKSLIVALAVVLATPALAAGRNIRVQVNGMVCGFCAQGITKKFKVETAIASVDVNLTDKIVKLVTKEGQDIADARILEILRDAGYNVVKIDRE